jgi:uncharacterized protein
MKYSKELEKYNNILKNEKFNQMDKYTAHGNTSTREHSINVAELSLKIAEKFKLKINKDELIKSALLHDMFLYDWHDAPKEVGLHGFTHSRIAADKAKKEFDINDRVYSNILTHMWPLNITKIPKTKEGFIVSIADKICSLQETFSRKK